MVLGVDEYPDALETAVGEFFQEAFYLAARSGGVPSHKSEFQGDGREREGGRRVPIRK